MTPREDVIASMPGAWVWRQLCAGRSMAEIAEGTRVTVEELDIAVWRYRTERTSSRKPTQPPKASPPRRFSWQQPQHRA